MATISVTLRRGWFAPDSALYEPKDNPHSFPADWKEKLPSTAVVAGYEPKEEPKAEAAPKVAAKPETK